MTVREVNFMFVLVIIGLIWATFKVWLTLEIIVTEQQPSAWGWIYLIW